MNKLKAVMFCFDDGVEQDTLELDLPLGGKKGMFKWEMLIMQLYPWLSVREVSSNIATDGLLGNTSSQHHVQTNSEGTPEKEKSGFFSRLFGKSK